MISTLFAIGLFLIFIAFLIALFYVGVYAVVYAVPILMTAAFCYVFYSVAKQAFFRDR